MKSILMSIKPKWIEKIASGEKTVEVRKTVPKCGTPFKVYMYCTKAEKKGGFYRRIREVMPIDDYNEIVLGTKEITRLDGYVVGEFVCDNVRPFEVQSPAYWYMMNKAILEQACLTKEELHDYIGAGNLAQGWHISDLKIYDKPKELSEFRKPQCIYGEGNEQCTLCDKSGYNEDMRLTCYNTITRPPQSWCYVEEK